jgi:hypothetical protein
MLSARGRVNERDENHPRQWLLGRYCLEARISKAVEAPTRATFSGSMIGTSAAARADFYPS